MTAFSLSLRSDHLDELKRHLHREDKDERAAYILCNRVQIGNDPWDRQAHEKFLTAKILPVPDEDIIDSTPTRVTWRTRSFAQALKKAQMNNAIVAIVHNHPSGMMEFSSQDDENEPDLLQMAKNRNGPDTKIISLLLTQDELLAGRVWLHPSPSGSIPLKIIRVFGPRIKLHYPDRFKNMNLPAFNRQALAFGEALNQDLRQLRVGVVGCGGTGSAVATLLARLGVGQMALFDKDIVDETNLNRLHGARQADADAMLPKVTVVARSITEMGLGVRTIPVHAWIGDPTCRDALKSCDVIFGCTDDHDGRLFLNRFAYYYLTPIIDIGLAIDVGKGLVPEIMALDGRVTVLGQDHTCLVCRGVINPQIAASEALKRKNPSEYEKRKAEAYVFGEGNPRPAVVTFTTELACMAVNELIHRLQGFRGTDGDSKNRVRKFHLNMDRLPGHSPGAGCNLCSGDDILGKGDVEPFMGRID